MADKYKYRGCPADIMPKDKLYCVVGSHVEGGGGVLEWCYDIEDACRMMDRMIASREFRNLTAGKYE